MIPRTLIVGKVYEFWMYSGARLMGRLADNTREEAVFTTVTGIYRVQWSNVVAYLEYAVDPYEEDAKRLRKKRAKGKENEG